MKQTKRHIPIRCLFFMNWLNIWMVDVINISISWCNNWIICKTLKTDYYRDILTNIIDTAPYHKQFVFHQHYQLPNTNNIEIQWVLLLSYIAYFFYFLIIILVLFYDRHQPRYFHRWHMKLLENYLSTALSAPLLEHMRFKSLKEKTTISDSFITTINN
jgi:hypothetical protein